LACLTVRDDCFMCVNAMHYAIPGYT